MSLSEEYDELCAGFAILHRENRKLTDQLAAAQRRLEGAQAHASSLEIAVRRFKAQDQWPAPPTKLEVAGHAVERFRERVRPDLDGYDAYELLVRLVKSGAFVRTGENTGKVILGPVTAKCHLRHGIINRWVVKTVTADAWDQALAASSEAVVS